MIKLILIIFSLFLPSMLFAQQVDYTAPSLILSYYSMFSAIAVGVITSVMVFINGRRMHGGVFGNALIYFSVGMIIVLVGFLFPLLSVKTTGSFAEIFGNILYIIGYIAMAFAADKILKVTKEK
jgi:uncharacterized membrane protein YagU involved in acid resistance